MRNYRSVLGDEDGSSCNDECDHVKIANIQFAFCNGKIIKALKNRGEGLINGNFSKVTKYEDIINKEIEDHPDELRRPVKAFVTFT